MMAKDCRTFMMITDDASKCVSSPDTKQGNWIVYIPPISFSDNICMSGL